MNQAFPLVIRGLLRRAISQPMRWSKRLRIVHPERLPRRREPLILASNHAAFADTVWIAAAVRPNFVVCGAKPRLFKTRRKRAIMAVGNVLQVVDHDTYLADCTELLRRGNLLLCYPEMGRFPAGLGPFSTWPAEVALATSVEILPIYLYGTSVDHHGPAEIRVGERCSPSGTADQLTTGVRAAIVELGRL